MFGIVNPEYYYSILTINTVTILLHDVIHYSQHTAHNIWQVRGGFSCGRGNDFGGEELVVLSDLRLENGEQSCKV